MLVTDITVLLFHTMYFDRMFRTSFGLGLMKEGPASFKQYWIQVLKIRINYSSSSLILFASLKAYCIAGKCISEDKILQTEGNGFSLLCMRKRQRKRLWKPNYDTFVLNNLNSSKHGLYFPAFEKFFFYVLQQIWKAADAFISVQGWFTDHWQQLCVNGLPFKK